VMLPLDSRQRAVPPAQSDDQLPLILGIRGEVQPGRKLDSAQVQAALKWIESFEASEMANVVELKKIDIVSPEVLIVTTGQGSEVTFGLDKFEQQLLRWQAIHDECARSNRAIATLNLAVTDNTPLRFTEPSVTPLTHILTITRATIMPTATCRIACLSPTLAGRRRLNSRYVPVPRRAAGFIPRDPYRLPERYRPTPVERAQCRRVSLRRHSPLTGIHHGTDILNPPISDPCLGVCVASSMTTRSRSTQGRQAV